MNVLTLHPSEIDRRLACSYRQVLWNAHEHEFLMTASMLIGRALHKTVSGDCLSYINSRDFQHPADLLDQSGALLKAEYEKFSGRVEFSEDSDFPTAFARLRQSIGVYTSNIRSLPWFKPIAVNMPVEKSVSFIEGTVIIRGELDLLIEAEALVEFKTKGSLPSAYTPSTNIQTQSYLYCMSIDDAPASKIIMVATKFPKTFKARRDASPKFRVYDTTFNQQAFARIIHILRSLLLESNSGLHHPAQQGDFSPCPYCGGRKMCQYYLGE